MQLHPTLTSTKRITAQLKRETSRKKFFRDSPWQANVDRETQGIGYRPLDAEGHAYDRLRRRA